MIKKMPAVNATRPFPPYIYGPIVQNVRTLLNTPSLRLVLQGLVFFTFVVAFMRAAVYMLGESQNPRWDELKTSVIVGTVALGIGLGSPLAGWLSGKRIELRLVIVGTIGMIIMLVAGAVFIDTISILVACIIGIGFFTGFYIVPLFTLLQHKSPKGNKGDMIATSNFVNTTGAILATILFKVVVLTAHSSGLTPEIDNRQRTDFTKGELRDLQLAQGRPVYFEVLETSGKLVTGGTKPVPHEDRTIGHVVKHIFEGSDGAPVLELHKDVPIKLTGQPFMVDVSKFEIANITHYDLVPTGVKPTPDYDNRHLPRFLFLGAALLTFLMLMCILRPLLRVRREQTELPHTIPSAVVVAIKVPSPVK